MKADTNKAVICGFPVSTYNLQGNFEFITKCIKEERGLWVVTLNLEMIYKAKTDKKYRNLLQGADLYIADGVPLIWASGYKKKTKKIAGRSNGTDLVEKLLAADLDFRLGVIGGTDPAFVVKKYNPDLLKDAYFYDGTVDIKDQDRVNMLVKNLEQHDTQVLFLSLGVPKQDQLGGQVRNQIDSIVTIGVGGAFDLLSGSKKRAPRWMQKNGLEWLFRLLTEPKRLAKRYLVHYPHALYFLIKDVF